MTSAKPRYSVGCDLTIGLAFLGLAATTCRAEYAAPDLVNVPIARLIANLEGAPEARARTPGAPSHAGTRHLAGYQCPGRTCQRERTHVTV